MYQAFRLLLSEGGWLRLWRGAVPNCQRAGLVNMAGETLMFQFDQYIWMDNLSNFKTCQPMIRLNMHCSKIRHYKIIISLTGYQGAYLTIGCICF